MNRCSGLCAEPYAYNGALCVPQKRPRGTDIVVQLFDSELYALICESPEVHAQDDPLEPFDLRTKIRWLVRVN